MHEQKFDETVAYLQYCPLGVMPRVCCLSLFLSPHDDFAFPPCHDEAQNMEHPLTRELFALLQMWHLRKRAADKKQ